MLSRAWDAAQFTVFTRFAQSPGFSAQKRINQMWWQTSVVPVLRRSRHGDTRTRNSRLSLAIYPIQASLGYLRLLPQEYKTHKNL